MRRVALAADVPRFSTHTTRHLCLTDLARMGWELHAIATFAGHRSTDSTLRYIHLSGRDLATKLNRSMTQMHGSASRTLARLGDPGVGRSAHHARRRRPSRRRPPAWSWPVRAANSTAAPGCSR